MTVSFARQFGFNPSYFHFQSLFGNPSLPTFPQGTLVEEIFFLAQIAEGRMGKVKLSMKRVDQETGADLEAEEAE